MEILKNARQSGRAVRSSWLGLVGLMLALMTAVLFSVDAYAAEQVGRILAVKGTVSVRHQGAAKPVVGNKNSPVFLGDKINTGKGAKVKLLMKDESIVTLGQNSELVVDTFVFNPETNTRKSVLKLAKGMVRNLISKSFSGLGSVFQVRTPTAVAGAMGTENLVWVFRGDTIPSTIADAGSGVTDISRIVLNSQFDGGGFMNYGSPGSIDWLRLADLGDGTGGEPGGGPDGGEPGGDGGDGGEGGGPLNTLGVGISRDTSFGNEDGEVILNNGFASLALEGQGPTEPFLLPPGTFGNLLGATELSDEGGDGGSGGDDGDGGSGGDGGDGGGATLGGVKDDMQDTLDGDGSGGLDGFTDGLAEFAVGEFGQFADGGNGGGDLGPPDLNPPGRDPDNPAPNAAGADLGTEDPGGGEIITTPTPLFAADFEPGTPDTDRWFSNNAYVTTAYDSILPAGGVGMAMVHNAPEFVSMGFLMTVFNVIDPGNYSIAFDFNFTTQEATGINTPFDDFFTAFINTASGGRIDLAYASVNGSTFTPIDNPTLDGPPQVNSETGWQHVDQVASLPAGQNTLNFEVHDAGDPGENVVDSVVFLDNIAVTPTTAPTTVTEVTGTGTGTGDAIY